MQHTKQQKAIVASSTRVWSIKDFCRQYQIDKSEEAKLTRLFGEFATACELRYNVRRTPRVH